MHLGIDIIFPIGTNFPSTQKPKVHCTLSDALRFSENEQRSSGIEIISPFFHQV